eukprot:859998_1
MLPSSWLRSEILPVSLLDQFEPFPDLRAIVFQEDHQRMHRAFRLTGRLSRRGRSRPIGNLNLALENLDRNVQSLEERLSGVASSGAGWHQNFLRGTDTRSSHGRDFVGDGHIADDLDVLVGEHEAIVSNDARNEGLEVAVLLGVLADEHVDHGRQ